MEATTIEGERVRNSTSNSINAKIDEKTVRDLAFLSAKGPEAISERIKQLDKEWDIERTLEVNAATLALTGVVLGFFKNPKWLILPAIVTTFLAQHAIQGWCPPLPLFRRLGIRTRPEIDREKYALKALRGDFIKAENPNTAWEAVNR